MSVLLHATAVDLRSLAPWRTAPGASTGVLLLGPSGAGKSDLALRLIDGGALLVSDDQTELVVESGRLIARAPASIKGRLEVRGVGLVSAPHAESCAIAAAFLLTPGRAIARMPEPDAWSPPGLAGAPLVPLLLFDPFTAAAASKLRAAAAALSERV